MIEDGSSGSSHYIYIPTSKNENGSLCVPVSSQVDVTEVAYITPAYIPLARIPSQVYTYLLRRLGNVFIHRTMCLYHTILIIVAVL